MPPITQVELWPDAEETLLKFLISETGSKKGSNAFLAELPATAYNSWFFEINGGGEPLDFEWNMDTPGGCGDWKMWAKVEGVFIVRRDAQLLAGKIRSILPTEEKFKDNIFRFKPRSEPMVNEALVPDRRGKNIKGWKLIYELEVSMQQ